MDSEYNPGNCDFEDEKLDNLSLLIAMSRRPRSKPTTDNFI